MHPPHLPNPTCNIKSHEHWISLKLIVIVTFFGLLAGVTGAMIVIGWIWPNYGGGDTWVVSQNRASNRPLLAESVRIETAERIFGVYSDSVKIGETTVMNSENKIGEAIAVSSDGWAVMHPSRDVVFSLYKKWRVLGQDGVAYKVDSLSRDTYSPFVYIKISLLDTGVADEEKSLSQFKVASFSDSFNISDEIYIFENGNWKYSRLGFKKNYAYSASHLDSAPNYGYEVEGNFEPGSIAVTNRGRMVGYISENGLLLPNIQITRILPEILSKQKVVYPSFGVAGWFGFEQPSAIGSEIVEGFLVDRVWSKKSKLRRGDIIEKINGQIVRDENPWYNIGSNQANLTIRRAGKVFDISAEVIPTEAGVL